MPRTKPNLPTLRVAVISELAAATEELVLSPDVEVSDKLLDALGSTLEAYTAIVLATTTSSNPTYAMRDLPASEATYHQRAQHGVRVLRQLYGPQAVPA